MSVRCDNLPGPSEQVRFLALVAPSILPSNPHPGDPRLQKLQLALEARPPRLVGENAAPQRAAVALLIRPGESDLEILLIERPVRASDPWSGHMAFPGGRRDAEERDVETAIRETHEEVGIDLRKDGKVIGRLDDVRPNRGGPQIAVAAFVFSVHGDVRIVPDPREVAATLWIPLDHLVDPAHAAEHLHPLASGERLSFPAVTYDDRLIWGLTYRMLMQFLEIARTLSSDSPAS